MIIDTCLRTSTFSDHWFILFPWWFVPSLSPFSFSLPFWPFSYNALPLLGPKGVISWRCCTWESRIIETSSYNMTGTLSSKQSFFKRVGKLSLYLGTLCDTLSISRCRSSKFGRSKESVFELLIKLSKMSVYVIGIAVTWDFSSVSSSTSMDTYFKKIVTIRFWRRRDIPSMFSSNKYRPL